MRRKKPTVSQKSGGKDKLPPPPDQDPTQRHQKHHAGTSPATPPSEPPCGFLIRWCSESVTSDLSFTIDVDMWRATPSCHPTRSGGSDGSGTTRKGASMTPYHTASPQATHPDQPNNGESATASVPWGARARPMTHRPPLLYAPPRTLPSAPPHWPPMRDQMLTIEELIR
jgi:hypothetical protein